MGGGGGGTQWQKGREKGDFQSTVMDILVSIKKFD